MIVALPSHTLLTSPLWCQTRHEKEAQPAATASREAVAAGKALASDQGKGKQDSAKGKAKTQGVVDSGSLVLTSEALPPSSPSSVEI